MNKRWSRRLSLSRSRQPLARGSKRLPNYAASCVAQALESRMLLSGAWTQLAHAAPGSIDTMMLMTDGTVIAPSDGDSAGNDWVKLTPDSTGSYINGTWSVIAKSNDTRLFDSTQVMQNGNLFLAGGEYGTGAATGETYNPITNVWTRLPTNTFGSFIDSESQLLPNGDVLVAPVSPSPAGFTTIYNPSTNTWSQGPKIFRGNSTDEQGFVKLSDGSFITIDSNTTSERYIPAGYPGTGGIDAVQTVNFGGTPTGG